MEELKEKKYRIKKSKNREGDRQMVREKHRRKERHLFSHLQLIFEIFFILHALTYYPILLFSLPNKYHFSNYTLKTCTHLSQMNIPAGRSNPSNLENVKIQLLFHYSQNRRLYKLQREHYKNESHPWL